MRDSTPPRTSTATVGARSHARIEEELRRLEGVASASIERAPGGRLGTVHVTADPDWLIATVRRDVESRLEQRFGLQVPARLLDVTQAPTMQATDASAAATPAADEADDPDDPEPERLVLDTIHLALRANGTSVGVDLLADGERLRGTAGPVGPGGVLAGVVDATIDALRKRVDDELSTLTAEVIEVGGDQLAIATLGVSDGRGQHRLNGSAIVRGSVEDAMARATLDATNRIVGS